MKVSAEVSVTLKVGDLKGYEFAKITCGFYEIDPELPLEKQLSTGKKALAKAYEELESQIGDEYKKINDARKPKQLAETRNELPL